MTDRAIDRKVRVGVYGCGTFANETHIPNLMRLPGAEVVALCDVNGEALAATAERFGVATERTYRDAHRMLSEASLDALFSIVRARDRTDVEIRAAREGIHLFSEKPQAETMELALRIDRAVRDGGVMSTVGFRERYRPILQEARAHLSGKAIVQADFRAVRGPRAPRRPGAGTPSPEQLPDDMLMSWGVHAVDYIRFMTGLDVDRVQGFTHQPESYLLPIAQSLHGQLVNGAPVSVAFIQATQKTSRDFPAFDIYYDGGMLTLVRCGRTDWALLDTAQGGECAAPIAGEEVEGDVGFDAWFEQDRCFIEAVRTGDRGLILNDYHDGLFSLAPVLAARASARQGGAVSELASYLSQSSP
jgi:predicted dehydrogenase